MKREKILHGLVMLFVTMLCVCFVSCGDDDDDEFGGDSSELISKLQGIWEFYSGKETVMGMTITMDRSSLKEMKKSMEQMMGSRVEFWDETLNFNGNKVNGVNYTLKGSELILDGIEAMDGIKLSIKSVTSSTLVLREVISMEDLDMTADMEYRK